MRLTGKKLVAGGLVAGGMVVLRPSSGFRRALRRRVERVAARARYERGRLHGVEYRIRHGQPDPTVANADLADRVRSSIGPLVGRLDLPHIHVLANDHVVLLHGEVGSAGDAEAIEAAVAAISGVDAVESYLHVGLIRSDTRPSQGRAEEVESAARKRLVDAAVTAGAGPILGPITVKAVLSSFSELLAEDERAHVASHLPADVRAMFVPPHRAGRVQRTPRTVDELVAQVLRQDETLRPDAAPGVVAAVLGALRALVPEEAADVAAILPAGMRAFWSSPRVAGS
jgi:uncharacterized protein (DUF2267 family)